MGSTAQQLLSMTQNQQDDEVFDVDELVDLLENSKGKKRNTINKNYIVTFWENGYKFYAINNRRKPTGISELESRCKMMLTTAAELAKWLKENSTFKKIEVEEV